MENEWLYMRIGNNLFAIWIYYRCYLYHLSAKTNNTDNTDMITLN